MFFTVNTPIKIEGKHYIPCVCYQANGTAMELTVDKLCEEGKAQKHDKFIFFCNGKPVEQKAETTVEVPGKPEKTKKAKKTKEVKTETTDVVTEEADVLPPENEVEDF